MSLFKALKKPVLIKKDEEYEMLFEVAQEALHQKKEKSKNGTPAEIVIREHLQSRGFNVTFEPNVKIAGSEIKNDMFLLHATSNPDQTEYPADDVKMVIEIKTNASANQSKTIKKSFDELKTLAPHLSFAVVILSERLGYAHEVTDEKLGDPRYRSFTLVSRRVNPKETGGMSSEKNLADLLKAKDMKKTGAWERFLAYLKQA
jgi:hypothetical protein